MSRRRAAGRRSPPRLDKAGSGVEGLDDILAGGYPRGRATLIAGNSGCGKTVLGMQFLLAGAAADEPGLFVSFEESADALMANMAGFGWDLAALRRQKKLELLCLGPVDEHVEVGDFDLAGLFAQLDHYIAKLGVRRVVIDTLDVLLAAFRDRRRLRQELHRLFSWLGERGLTAIVTAEAGGPDGAHSDVQQFVSDCVIWLEHLAGEQATTRRLQVRKYRGSAHGDNQYPFLIGADGVWVLPVTGSRLDHPAARKRVSTGLKALDAMFGGRGLYRGATVLVSGSSGTGKSSLAAHFVDAACRRGERALYFAYEESPAQIERNMRSIGLTLDDWRKQGLLEIHSTRPTAQGLEQHLIGAQRAIEALRPDVVVLDPISSFDTVGSEGQVHAVLTRLLDGLKRRGVTVLLTYLAGGGESPEQTSMGISSVVDTWLQLRDIEQGGERNKALFILKSRGMAHSNQLREYRFTAAGIELAEVYLGPEGVLTGAARAALEAREAEAARRAEQQADHLELALDERRRAHEARMAALQAEYAYEAAELERALAANRDQAAAEQHGRDAMRRRRDGER